MSKIRLCFFCPSRNILSTRSDMVMVRPRRGCEEECGCGYDWYGYLPHWPSVSRPHTEYASCNPTREMGDHYFMQRFIFWRITCQSSICRRAMHWLESALLRKTAYNTIAFRKKSWDECIKSTLTYLDISAQIVETKFYLGTALDIGHCFAKNVFSDNWIENHLSFLRQQIKSDTQKYYTDRYRHRMDKPQTEVKFKKLNYDQWLSIFLCLWASLTFKSWNFWLVSSFYFGSI